MFLIPCLSSYVFNMNVVRFYDHLCLKGRILGQISKNSISGSNRQRGHLQRRATSNLRFIVFSIRRGDGEVSDSLFRLLLNPKTLINKFPSSSAAAAIRGGWPRVLE
jgi:hypothetical protein